MGACLCCDEYTVFTYVGSTADIALWGLTEKMKKKCTGVTIRYLTDQESPHAAKISFVYESIYYDCHVIMTPGFHAQTWIAQIK